jgi:aspartate aminotransferase
VTMRVWETLRRLGVDYGRPAGAFYLYPDFSSYAEMLKSRYGIRSSEDLSRELLTRMSVAALPGTAFGEHPETLRLRISSVDFNGAQILKLYYSGAWQEDDQFLDRAAPRVLEACRRIEQFFQPE